MSKMPGKIQRRSGAKTKPKHLHLKKPIQNLVQHLGDVMDCLTTSVFVCLLSVDGLLAYANRAALEAVDAELDDLVGKPFDAAPWWTFSEASRQRLCAAVLSAAHGEASRFDFTFQNMAGQLLTMDFTLHPVFGPDTKVAYLVASAHDITEHKKAQQHIHFLAHYDGLTGLANRVLFLEGIDKQANQSLAERSRFAVVIADVVRFRTINATLGRQAGDQLLQQIAERFRRHAAAHNWLARTSADQFAALVTGVGTAEEVGKHIEQRLRECFDAPFMIGNTRLKISAKVGVGMFPEDGADAESLFRHAEAALNRAKATDVQYLFYTKQMTDRTAHKLTMENRLRLALEQEEFVLHYQPKVNPETLDIEGVEALIRWNSPELGLVPPTQFIPLMEETGLILEVGAWVLRRAAQDHRCWVEEGLAAPCIAVNVSAIQLRKSDFIQTVQQALAYGVTPPGIDLEITESVVTGNTQCDIDTLTAIRDMGMNIAIDDFGTGYSSLAYLTKLPVQTLKIDRLFIFSMLDNPDTMTLVSAIISLAHSLRLNVVAEGVETEEQANVLRAMGCDQMQGYFIGKPVSMRQLAVLLARQQHNNLLAKRTG